jgi:hypothetical protein
LGQNKSIEYILSCFNKLTPTQFQFINVKHLTYYYLENGKLVNYLLLLEADEIFNRLSFLQLINLSMEQLLSLSNEQIDYLILKGYLIQMKCFSKDNLTTENVKQLSIKILHNINDTIFKNFSQDVINSLDLIQLLVLLGNKIIVTCPNHKYIIEALENQRKIN